MEILALRFKKVFFLYYNIFFRKSQVRDRIYQSGAAYGGPSFDSGWRHMTCAGRALTLHWPYEHMRWFREKQE